MKGKASITAAEAPSTSGPTAHFWNIRQVQAVASHSPNYLCSFHLDGGATSPIVSKSSSFALTKLYIHVFSILTGTQDI